MYCYQSGLNKIHQDRIKDVGFTADIIYSLIAVCKHAQSHYVLDGFPQSCIHLERYENINRPNFVINV